MQELYVAFSRLRTKLRRSRHLREYFAVVEMTKAGALHLHVLATGRYLPQRELSKLAALAGFGRVADIRAVTGTGEGSASAYLVKTLAGYATKANAAKLAKRGAQRLRPVRTSRAWFAGGMAEAEREVGRRMAGELSLAPDPGPWLFVVKGGDGALHVRGQAAPLVPLTTGPSRAAARRSGTRAARTGASGERRPRAGASFERRGIAAVSSELERQWHHFPRLAPHRAAWCALGRARLHEQAPSLEYESLLVSLMASFLGKETPSVGKFGETVQRGLDALPDAHAPGVLVPVDLDDRWRRAARLLRVADEFSRRTLS